MVDLRTGDCLKVLAELEACSVDALVTDPPYGLGKPPPIREVLACWLAGETYEAKGGGFMGKAWDAMVPPPEVWAAALRVVKPGAWGVVFAGTRTVDLMGISLRLGGWEVRDQIAYLYGSGFPKSLDIGAAIDRSDGVQMTRDARLRCTAWLRSTGITASQINEATKTHMASHYLTAKSQPAIPTLEHLNAIRHLLPPVPAWLEKYAHRRSIESENMKKRPVIGKKTSAIANRHEKQRHTIGASKAVLLDVTKAYTPAAARFDGYGTALKPALEPALLVRRPLAGTYADNATRWGVGGLNIDAGRIATAGEQITTHSRNIERSSDLPGGYGAQQTHQTEGQKLGRWPANVMLGHNEDCGEDCTAGCAVAMLDEQSGTEGGASRFFYTAKPSRSEREAGLDGLPVWTGAEAVNRDPDSAGINNPRAGAGRTAGEIRNHHPTVKPVDLMRHLVQLVTPPATDGRRPLILDPFMGSGTTGMAAAGLGLDFMGIDLDPAHVQIARARIEWAAPGRRVDCDQEDTREQPQQGRLF